MKTKLAMILTVIWIVLACGIMIVQDREITRLRAANQTLEQSNQEYLDDLQWMIQSDQDCQDKLWDAQLVGSHE
jgi:hypothetical protein